MTIKELLYLKVKLQESCEFRSFLERGWSISTQREFYAPEWNPGPVHRQIFSHYNIITFVKIGLKLFTLWN